LATLADTRTPDLERTAAARETNKQLAAERAVHDPVKLDRALRIYRAALALGLVTGDGFPIEQVSR
jgi:hypothetical protein